MLTPNRERAWYRIYPRILTMPSLHCAIFAAGRNVQTCADASEPKVFSMRLDHICIAVKSIDSAIARLAPLLGYAPKTERITNTRQQVTVLFLAKAGSLDLKLIQPSSDDSPLWTSLRKGEGLHHLCFKTDDTAARLEELVSLGMRVLSQPAPGEAFNDHLIAFGYAGCGLNIELIDTDDRRGILASAAREVTAT
jgi:methylmalonyl-CoA/ethylmalonyl-CoA epimerase